MTEPLRGRPAAESIDAKWDVDALKSGASVTVVFGAPFFVLAGIVGNGRGSLGLLLVLIGLIGFVLGAGVAAWRQRCRSPLTHGIITSAGTYVVVQGVFVVVRLIRGDSVNLFTIVFTLTVTVFAGMIGGLLGIRLQKSGFEARR